MLFSPLSAFLLLMTTCNRVVVGTTQVSALPKGFVTVNGTQFELDGKPFVSMTTSELNPSIYTERIFQAFVGANSYVRYSKLTSCMEMKSLNVSVSIFAVAPFAYNAS